jgi:hypothetical protein|tara:strand:+ start:59 stop:292 length:234 start_codon:yes stop_codon:yes gene_type:complete
MINPQKPWGKTYILDQPEFTVHNQPILVDDESLSGINLFEEISDFYKERFQPRLYGLPKQARIKSAFESWTYSSQCW